MQVDRRDRTLKRQIQHAVERRTSLLTLVLEWLLVFFTFTSHFQENFLIIAPEFAFPYPCSFVVGNDYSFAKGTVVSTVSAYFAPAVPPHSGCFIQKTWADFPQSDSCLLSLRSSELLLPTSYVRAADIKRKKHWHLFVTERGGCVWCKFCFTRSAIFTHWLNP